MYISLEQAKQHLNIEVEFTNDDSYIDDLIEVCEVAITNHINQSLDSLGETIPTPIKHSILLLVGNLYANREPVSFSSPVKVPYTIDYLLQPYIQF